MVKRGLIVGRELDVHLQDAIAAILSSGITMALPRETRLARCGGALPEVALTPEEFFVLTRIEGNPSVGEILASSGLSREEAERILGRLLQIGAIQTRGEEASIPSKPGPLPARPGPLHLRERVEERRRLVLRTELRSGVRSSPLPTLSSSDTRDPTEEGETEASEGFVLPMARRDDPRVNPTIALSVEEQRWLLALADGQAHLSPFEFLGLEPTHDIKRIRRAFYETSRRLHPDAYYGRDIGVFHALVTELFRRAKFYFEELRREDVRRPYVEQAIRARAERERQRRLRERSAETVAALREEQAAAELEQRRHERAIRRAEREKNAVRKRLEEGAKAHMRDAEEALAEGNLARAANAYRLALQIEPENDALRQMWLESKRKAEQKRAQEAFSEAQRHRDYGQLREALPWLVEAAETDPTLEHLVAASDGLLEVDSTRARDFAMAAFDALVTSLAKGEAFLPADLAAMHVTIGRAFLGAGQKESAKQQALAAKGLRPDDPDVRALLKSLKVK